MSDPERMSAVDFIISVLREHEKNLDSLIEKLDAISKNLSELTASKKKNETTVSYNGHANVHITCEDWEEFRELCKEAETFSFHLGNELRIMALHGNTIYEYKEPIPKHTEHLECGVPIYFQAQLNPEKIRRFLLRELNTSDKRIIHGEIQFSP